MFMVLVCEDDRNIRHLMCEYLTRNGYQHIEAENGEEALEWLEKMPVDLLITDIMMPKMNGYDLARAIRDAGYQQPILMITAKERLEDKALGFSIGVDDYMVKPIDMDEMIMRVAALMRRARIASDKKIVIGNTTVNYDSGEIITDGRVLSMPLKEFRILFMLLSTPNRIFTRMQIMDEVWGYDTESDERTVDVHIKRLRSKIEEIKDFSVVTVKGVGYKAVRT